MQVRRGAAACGSVALVLLQHHFAQRHCARERGLGRPRIFIIHTCIATSIHNCIATEPMALVGGWCSRSLGRAGCALEIALFKQWCGGAVSVLWACDLTRALGVLVVREAHGLC